MPCGDMVVADPPPGVRCLHMEVQRICMEVQRVCMERLTFVLEVHGKDDLCFSICPRQARVDPLRDTQTRSQACVMMDPAGSAELPSCSSRSRLQDFLAEMEVWEFEVNLSRTHSI